MSLECVRVWLAPFRFQPSVSNPHFSRILGRKTSKKRLGPVYVSGVDWTSSCTCGRVSRPPLSCSLLQKNYKFCFFLLYFAVDFIVRLVVGQVGFLSAGEAAVGSHEWSEMEEHEGEVGCEPPLKCGRCAPRSHPICLSTVLHPPLTFTLHHTHAHGDKLGITEMQTTAQMSPCFWLGRVHANSQCLGGLGRRSIKPPVEGRRTI